MSEMFGTASRHRGGVGADGRPDVPAGVSARQRQDLRQRLRPTRGRIAKAAVGVVAAFVVLNIPQNASGYTTNLLTLMAITVLPVLSLTILFGYAGQVSLGQAAFYGLGSYTYAYLTTTHSVSPWLAMVAAVGLSSLVAFVIGRGLLRLRGYYLAMVTAAFGVIVANVFSNATSVTGGYSGIAGIPSIGVFGFSLGTPERFYYLSIGVAVLALVLVRTLAAGEYGRVLRTMRESETACAAFGISVSGLKAQVFALSAGLAGFGGCLFAQYTEYISPDNFGPDLSVLLFLGAVIGGLASPWGALLGAGYVILLPELVSGHSDYEIAITGVITIVVILLAPAGIAGLARTLGWHVFRRGVR